MHESGPPGGHPVHVHELELISASMLIYICAMHMYAMTLASQCY